jgi:hypothetical protein
MKKFLYLFLVFCNISYAENIKNYINANSSASTKEVKQLYPFVYFDFKGEVFYDRLSLEDENPMNFFYTQSELLINLNLNRFLTIHTNFGVEKIKGSFFTPSSLVEFDEKEKAFAGTSLTMKELSMRFNFDRILIDVGKISLNFGGGNERWSDYFYDIWYGVGGTFLNQGYALEEKIGFKVNALAVDQSQAKINFEISAFSNDNTVLFKKPFFVKRQIEGFAVPEGNKRNAGSAKSLKSYATSVKGFIGFSQRDILSFNFGYRRQGSEEGAGEHGASATAQYTIIFFDDLVLSAFGEGVKIWNAYAIDGFSEKYLTASLAAGFAGLKLGIVKNDYTGKLQDFEKKIKFMEYFIGFEVPKTNLGLFLSRKEYKGNSSFSGFGMNVRYRIQ